MNDRGLETLLALNGIITDQRTLVIVSVILSPHESFVDVWVAINNTRLAMPASLYAPMIIILMSYVEDSH